MPDSGGALGLCLNLNRTTAVMIRQIDHRLSALHGLSLNDFTILHVTDQAPQGKLRRGDLAAHLGLTASAVTRLLLPLEKTGLVARLPDPRDARVSYVVLTDAGRERLADARPSAAQISEDLVGRLPADQVQVLTAALAALA